MILNNGKKFIIAATRSEGSSWPITSMSNSNVNIDASTARLLLQSNSNNYIDLIVGTGDTEPQVSDYKLVSQISSLTNVNRTQTYSVNNEILLSVTKTLTNNTSNSITVKEIALKTVGLGSEAILTRKVLDTPVVIASGETYSFNVTLK